MIENLYKEFTHLQIRQVFHLSVTSASGNTLNPLDTITCSSSLEGHSFQFNFIICMNLSTSLNFDLYFMQKHCIGLGWSAQEGDYLLDA